MKQNYLVLNILIYSFFIQFGYSQTIDTIKGRIISSISLKRPQGEIYIIEKGTTNGTIADSLGQFQFMPLKEKPVYILQVSSGLYPTLEYEFKNEWTKRKNQKTIVVNANCQINKQKAILDRKENNLKLYIIGGIAPIANSKRDSRFEKKYNIQYIDLGCDAKITECILDYNKYVFLYLRIKYGIKWRNKIRGDVEGLNEIR